MRTVLFFVYLCIFLLNGNNPVHAVTSSRTTCYTHSQYFQLSNPGESIATHDNGTILNSDNAPNQKEYLVIEEAEDEDSNNSISRKFKSPDKSCSALFYQFFSGYPVNHSKAAPLFYGRISYKYILQRALKV